MFFSTVASYYQDRGDRVLLGQSVANMSGTVPVDVSEMVQSVIVDQCMLAGNDDQQKIDLRRRGNMLSVADNDEFSFNRFGVQSPPFAQAWFEYRGDALKRDLGVRTSIPDVSAVGAFYHADTKRARALFISQYPSIRRAIPANARIVAVELWGYATRKVDLLGQIFLLVNEEGEVQIGQLSFASDGRWPMVSTRELVNLAAPVLMAVGAMHCRNVEVVDRQGPPKVVKVRGRKWSVVFKTLRVSTSAVKRYNSQDQNAGDADTTPALRRHIKRGHFRDYREGKGLFGKHKCVVWVGPHLVGSSGVGTVVKRYEVLDTTQ